MPKLLTLLDRLHWLWLLLAAPLMLFPSPTRSLAMLVVPGLWIISLVVGRRSSVIRRQAEISFIPMTPLNGVLLLLSVMVLVSLWATYDIAFSLEKISGVVLGLGVFYAIVRFGQRPWGWAFAFLAFLGAGVAVAAAGLLGVRWQVRFGFLAPILNRLPELLRGLPGAESGLQHNAVGGTLLWVLPSLLALSVHGLVSLRRWSASETIPV